VAYDESLADRVRELLSDRSEVSEKNMFGSLCFLIAGNLAVCVREAELLVRLDPEDADLAVTEEGVRVAEMRKRRMKGWVFVGSERLASDDELASWVDAGADRAASLEPKE
jgi:TfoX/Sxy family transcriptional regulator of competence genes